MSTAELELVAWLASFGTHFVSRLWDRRSEGFRSLRPTEPIFRSDGGFLVPLPSFPELVARDVLARAPARDFVLEGVRLFAFELTDVGYRAVRQALDYLRTVRALEEP
jgi:hypothetical protein